MPGIDSEAGHVIDVLARFGADLNVEGSAGTPLMTVCAESAAQSVNDV